MTEPRRSVCLAMLAVAACSGGDDRSAAASSDPAAAAAPATASRRAGLASYRPLLDEASRAELRAGGVMIDFGTPDQHKYTRGGWRSGWGAIAEVPDAPAGPEAGGDAAPTTWGAMASRRAWLELAADVAAPRAIMLRARSAVPGQTLSFHAGARQLGAVSLRGSWTVVAAEVPAGAVAGGRLRLELRAARAGAAGSPAAELDWLWLAAERSPSPPPALGPRVGPLTIAGTVRRTIAAPTPRTYSFYLTPPPGAQLVADLGATGRATFAVTATAEGRAPVELVREAVTGAWRERAVSLASFAGVPIRLDLTTVDQQGEAGWGEPEIFLPGKDAPARAAPSGPRPKNVVFILIDTGRADVFGPFGGKDRAARTPRYDQLAARSTVFASAYNNENWTKPSVATTLSGLYPSTHDTKRDGSELPGQVELLSERLQEDGFATAGFVANGYISEKFGFERGWDHFTNFIRENRPSEAEHVYREALAWLEQHRARSAARPFFLYIQTIDPHVRYAVAEKYWRPYFKGTYRGPLGSDVTAQDQVALSKKTIAQDRTNVAWLRALYHGEVSYHDEHMGRFLDQLERLGLRDETLLVVTNDHGEELGERGRFGHGHQVHEEMVRAPLLISYPPMFPAARIEDIVEHVDLAPTLLDALGRDPLPRADGQSFLPLVRGEPTARPRYAIIEFLDDRRAIRVDRLKMVATAGGGVQLYDLGADPGERKEAGARRPIARRLCDVHLGEGLAVPDKAARMRGAGGRARFRAGTADIDPAVRRQLEALGYFGSEAGQGDARGDDRPD